MSWTDPRSSRRSASLAIGIGVLAASLIALAAHGGSADASSTDFLDRIDTPAWQPPDSVFGPVWTVLYLMIAVSFVIAWRSSDGNRRPVVELFATNIALNLSWTPLFFGLESPPLAGVVILMLLASCLVLIGELRSIDRRAALLLVPYAAWVSFATVLNWTIVAINS